MNPKRKPAGIYFCRRKNSQINVKIKSRSDCICPSANNCQNPASERATINFPFVAVSGYALYKSNTDMTYIPRLITCQDL
jgi:hypothetical protein